MPRGSGDGGTTDVGVTAGVAGVAAGVSATAEWVEDGLRPDGAGTVTTRVGLTCRPTAKATNATIMDTIRSRGGSGKARPLILGVSGTGFGRSSLTK
jgi:hypothetical protein